MTMQLEVSCTFNVDQNAEHNSTNDISSVQSETLLSHSECQYQKDLDQKRQYQERFDQKCQEEQLYQEELDQIQEERLHQKRLYQEQMRQLQEREEQLRQKYEERLSRQLSQQLSQRSKNENIDTQQNCTNVIKAATTIDHNKLLLQFLNIVCVHKPEPEPEPESELVSEQESELESEQDVESNIEEDLKSIDNFMQQVKQVDNSDILTDEEKTTMTEMFSHGLNIHKQATLDGGYYTSFWNILHGGSIRLCALDWLIEQKHLDMQDLSIQMQLLNTINELLSCLLRENTCRIFATLRYIQYWINDNDPTLIVRRRNGTTIISNVLIHDFTNNINIILGDIITKIYLQYFIKYKEPIDEHLNIKNEKLMAVLQKYEIQKINVTQGETIHWYMPKLNTTIVEKLFAAQKENDFLMPVNKYYWNGTVFEPLIPMLLQRFALIKDQKEIVRLARYIELAIDVGYNVNSLIYDANNTTFTIMDYMDYYGWIYSDSPVENVLMKYCDQTRHNKPFEKRVWGPDWSDKTYNTYGPLFEKYVYIKDTKSLEKLRDTLTDMYKMTKKKPSCFFTSEFHTSPIRDLLLEISELSRKTFMEQYPEKN